MRGLDCVELHEQMGQVPEATNPTVQVEVAYLILSSIRASDDGDYLRKTGTFKS